MTLYYTECVFRLYVAEQSKIYYAKCEYLRASQYGVYAKGAAAGGIFCSVTLLILIIFIVIWNHIRYIGYWEQMTKICIVVPHIDYMLSVISD